jgi:hypothetical protein
MNIMILIVPADKKKEVLKAKWDIHEEHLLQRGPYSIDEI